MSIQGIFQITQSSLRAFQAVVKSNATWSALQINVERYNVFVVSARQKDGYFYEYQEYNAVTSTGSKTDVLKLDPTNNFT